MGTPYHSYNNRQSNPNIRRDVEEANRRLSEASAAAVDDRGRFATKSAPGSRSATPTRLRQKDRLLLQQQESARPQTSASQYSQVPAFANGNEDEDRLSFESR